MAILLAHEFGPLLRGAASTKCRLRCPFFIPLPLLSPFGTMGAIIGMSGRIRSRNALLDIGAAGPLAGLVVALPVLLIGLAQSRSRANAGHCAQEGQSLLYLLLKRVVARADPGRLGRLPEPTAFAGWVGLLVTMLNLMPFGQLDGGHIAYALFGEKQNAIARWLHGGLLLLFVLQPSALRGRR